MKAKVHFNRSFAASDAGAFEEAALWAASALEILAKAALANVTPVLVADPNDGSVLVAAGLSKDFGKFKSIQAKTLFSRCSRAFPPFNEAEANRIAIMRNEELHSALSPFAGVDQEDFWQRYWAQVVLLVHAQDRTLHDLVGAKRVATIEKHVAQNKANIAARVQAQIERAKQRYEAAATSKDVAAEIVKINERDELDWEHRSSIACPACGEKAWLLGDAADQEDVEYDYEDGTARELLSVWAEGFECEACGLHLNGAEYVEAAALPQTFEDDRPYEPGYDDYGND
jgi:hypothetical protein